MDSKWRMSGNQWWVNNLVSNWVLASHQLQWVTSGKWWVQSLISGNAMVMWNCLPTFVIAVKSGNTRDACRISGNAVQAMLFLIYNWHFFFFFGTWTVWYNGMHTGNYGSCSVYVSTFIACFCLNYKLQVVKNSGFLRFRWISIVWTPYLVLPKCLYLVMLMYATLCMTGAIFVLLFWRGVGSDVQMQVNLGLLYNHKHAVCCIVSYEVSFRWNLFIISAILWDPYCHV